MTSFIEASDNTTVLAPTTIMAVTTARLVLIFTDKINHKNECFATAKQYGNALY